MEREPRAALILNRFTRTLSIMFATNAVASILGVPPDQLQGKSLYECIAENCWGDAIKCLESAKANDSIAYLRFWSRDPRVQEESGENEGDVEMTDQEDAASEKDSDGGVRLDDPAGSSMDGRPDAFVKREATGSPQISQPITADELNSQHGFSAPLTSRAQTANTQRSPRPRAQREVQGRRREPIPTRELEAVVSCTSDGLVMVLRKARPAIPLHPPMVSTEFGNGLFAAPWSEHPVRPNYPPELFYDFQSPFLPQYMPVREHVKAAGGPPSDQLMNSIRDVAVFAWGLVGINGNLASYSHGKPSGESQPPDGLPIWDPAGPETSYLGPEPPSSRYGGDRLTKAHPDKLVPPVHSLQTPSPTTDGEQGHTHTLGRFNSIHSSHSDNPPWPNSATIRPSQEPRPSSHVQQSQYPITGYQDSTLQQWVDGVWPEGSTPYSQQNARGSRSD
ncbi:hypothetical protein E0Z10_g4691 [Xylaria hypoxylon]|uniref:PAS domain-containing protein n=1 Tax=Xylaria hypoxylon TaxID=37992 RepID=A0A4Z0YZW4_9PEZI|nr:hypothetical protein E0Z10_g4691 [Xylaria hypoxylon]